MILGPIHRVSSFRSWCLSLSKSRTRTKSLTRGFVHRARIFFSRLVWFSNIDQTAKACCYSFLSIILSILNLYGPSFSSSTSLSVASCIIPGVLADINSCTFLFVTFHLGTYPSIISEGVKRWRWTNWPFIEGTILGILRSQIVFAAGPWFSIHFFTWPMTNSTFFSTKLTEKEWLIGAQIWIVSWNSRNALISAPVKWEPLLWKMQRGNSKTKTKLSQKSWTASWFADLYPLAYTNRKK